MTAYHQREGERNIRVFLSVSMPRNGDLQLSSFIQKHLEARGVDVLRAQDIAPGHPVGEQIAEMMQACDMFVVELSSPSPNSFYELGMALGMGKPVFILEKGGAKLPESLELSQAPRLTYKDLQELVGVLKFLEPDFSRILLFLASHHSNAIEVSKRLSIPIAATYRRLKLMEDMKLVSSRREGRYSIWSLTRGGTEVTEAVSTRSIA